MTTVESYTDGDILSSYGTMTRLRSLFPTQCIAEYQSCRQMREAQRSLTDYYKTTTPACTTRIRGQQHRPSTADEKIPPEQEELHVAQQPIFDTSYPVGMTVK
eukprot:9095853-Ditylum_brightwellii.AAC.1